MDVNALHRDELEFELACRGVSDCQTVATMRKFLRAMLRREASGESLVAFKAPKCCIEEPAKEIIFCNNKLSSLVTLISELSEVPDGTLIRRIQSRLTHLDSHARLIVPTEHADIEKHLALLEEINRAVASLDLVEQEDSDSDFISEQDKDALQKSLGEEAGKILGYIAETKNLGETTAKDEKVPQLGEDKVRAAEMLGSQAASPHNVNFNNRDLGHARLNCRASKGTSSSQVLQRTSTIDHEFHRRKLVPLKDWGVKFTGNGTMSVNAFLERVDELKDARNANDEDLFRYAVDLFEEEALIWFRANKSTVSSWAELVKLLIDTFQSPNYQDELLEEIRRRTQSKQESVVIYLSVMQNMFNRLPVPLSELQKLVILRKNLQPYYQKEICRDTFQSVVELIAVLRVIERTKISCESFREPDAPNSQSLERDLAYRGAIDASRHKCNDVAAIENKVESAGNQAKCWNCRIQGHRFRDCKLPRQRLFCYKCGRFGNTVQKCTCSGTKEGNEQSESMSADQTPRN